MVLRVNLRCDLVILLNMLVMDQSSLDGDICTLQGKKNYLIFINESLIYTKYVAKKKKQICVNL